MSTLPNLESFSARIAPQQVKQEITNILGMEEWEKPYKYLRLAVDWGCSKQQMLKESLQKQRAGEKSF